MLNEINGSPSGERDSGVKDERVMPTGFGRVDELEDSDLGEYAVMAAMGKEISPRMERSLVMTSLRRPLSVFG